MLIYKGSHQKLVIILLPFKKHTIFCLGFHLTVLAQGLLRSSAGAQGTVCDARDWIQGGHTEGRDAPLTFLSAHHLSKTPFLKEREFHLAQFVSGPWDSAYTFPTIRIFLNLFFYLIAISHVTRLNSVSWLRYLIKPKLNVAVKEVQAQPAICSQLTLSNISPSIIRTDQFMFTSVNWSFLLSFSLKALFPLFLPKVF